MAVNSEFLTEYKLLNKIHESADNLIYRGINKANLQPVILKIAKSESCYPQQLVSYCHQYAIARKLALPSIVIPLDLVKLDRHLALVMADEGYISLSKYWRGVNLSLADFFPLALKIVGVVRQLQQHHTEHRQLNLDHVLINPDRDRIKITDFSQAVSFFPPATNNNLDRVSLSSDERDLGIIWAQLLTGDSSPTVNKLDASNLPDKLKSIILRLIDRDWGYQNLEQLEQDLQQFQQPNIEILDTANQTNRQFNSTNLLSRLSDLLQSLIETHPHRIFWKDCNGVFLGCNQKFAEDAGLSDPREIIGKTDYDLPWTKAEADYYRECDRRVMASNTPEYNLSETQLRADGTSSYLITNKVPLHNQEGKVVGIFGTYQDISEQKQSEQLLKQQSAAMEVALDGIGVLVGGKFIYLNQAHAEIFGYDSPQELLGKSWQILYERSEIAAIEAEIFTALEQNRFWQGELTGKRRDGSHFDQELSLVLTEDNLLVCVCRDISDRKLVERELRFTQFAVQNSADSIFYLNRQGKILALNRSACRHLGYSQKQLRGLYVFDIDASFSPEEREIAWAKHWEKLREQKTLVVESRHRTKEGKIVPVEVVANYLEFEGQEYNFARVIDISDRKRAETALAQQLKETKLLNQITQAIRQSLDTETIFQTATKEIRQLLTADRVSILRFNDRHCVEAEFVAEDVLPQYPSTLEEEMRHHYFTEHSELNYRQGEVLAIADTQNSQLNSLYLSVLNYYQIRAKLVIPLLIQNEQLWGLLCIHQCNAPRQWQQAEIEFVQKIAIQLCLAIQQAQLLDSEKQQQQQLKQEIVERQRIENNLEQRIKWELLQTQIAQDIRRSLNAETIFATATKQIRQNLNADRVAIFQFVDSNYFLGEFIAEDVLPAYTSIQSQKIEHSYLSKECLQDYSQGEVSAIADINDAHLSQEHLKLLARFQVRANLIVPLLQQERLWGLLFVHQCDRPREWQEIEIKFLQKIAVQLGLSLYQAELLRQAQEQRQIQSEIAQQQKALTYIIKNIHQTLDINQIYQACKIAVAEIEKLFDCDRIAIYQFTADAEGKLVFDAAVSNLDKSDSKPKFSLFSGKSSQITSNSEIAFSEQYARYHLKIIQKFQNQGYLAIPVSMGEQIWGFIAAVRHGDRREWKLKEIGFLEQVANQLGIAFQQAELLQQLKSAKQSADAANRAKSKFLANMSHELRTPLNAILGFSQLMRRDGKLDPQHQQTLKIINDSGEHLLNLINDVLEMSKIEAGKITLSTVDFNLHQLLIDLKQMLEQRATSKGLELNFHCDPQVPIYLRGDVNKLRQILINLLGNGIKFTKQGNVSLNVFCKSNTPAKLRQKNPSLKTIQFEIVDTGIGIATSELKYLFNPFYQSEAGVKFQQGTGLGLSISQKFVKLMNGKIQVESELGKGTTIRFSIELDEAENITQPKYPARQVTQIAPNTTIPKILVVEDKWESRELLVKLLESVGFEVKAVANGSEGVNLWREWQPALIWMDIQMPVMNGYQAIAQIRKEEARLSPSKSKPTVIVALTASVFKEDREKIIAVGGDEVVHKPFQETILWQTMARHLNLDFVYTQTESSPVDLPDRELLSESQITQLLATTTGEWLTQLHLATMELDEESLLELINQLDDNLAALSRTLETWLHDFKFDAIANCTERAINIKSSS